VVKAIEGVNFEVNLFAKSIQINGVSIHKSVDKGYEDAFKNKQ
jgi:hypothetical protein